MKTSLPRVTAFCLIGFPFILPLTAPAADSDPVVIKPAPESGDSAAQEELARARAENRRLAAELASAQSARDDFKTKLASSQSAVELLTTKNQQLEADLAGASTRLADSRHNESALRDQLASAKSNPPPPAPDLSAKLAEAENKLATTLRSFSQLQAENEKLQAGSADAARLRDELKQLRDEKASLETRLAAAPPHVTAKLAETEDKLSTTLRSFSLLQTENDQLKAQAADTAKLADELKTLREEKASLEEKLAAARAPAPAPDSAAKVSDTDAKLEAALRSYSLLQAENDRLKADAAQTAASAQASAAKSAGESAAQLSALFDELRQTKAQVTALSAENAQLKTRLALAGPPPGSTLASPSRPGATLAPAPAPATPPEPATSTPRQHVVAPGDTLAKISRQYYGTPNRWYEIQRANPDVIKNENNLPIGATLRIP